jgi:chitinase
MDRLTPLQRLVTQRLSKEGINGAFFTACLSEIMIGYYNTYSNEAKAIIKKVSIDDFKVEGNRHKRRLMEKHLEKEKADIMLIFERFEKSIIPFLRTMDNLDPKTRKTLETIENQIFEKLNPMNPQ